MDNQQPDTSPAVAADCSGAEVVVLRQAVKNLSELLAKGGPLNTERWTLDELLAELEKWKAVASGQTCVSFETLCYGSSSLWHQSHRENFRAVDRKPEALSRWMLDHAGHVEADFPAQVLGMLSRLHEENVKLKAALGI